MIGSFQQQKRSLSPIARRQGAVRYCSGTGHYGSAEGLDDRPCHLTEAGGHHGSDVSGFTELYQSSPPCVPASSHPSDVSGSPEVLPARAGAWRKPEKTAAPGVMAVTGNTGMDSAGPASIWQLCAGACLPYDKNSHGLRFPEHPHGPIEAWRYRFSDKPANGLEIGPPGLNPAGTSRDGVVDTP